jgi:hypothetical protein
MNSVNGKTWAIVVIYLALVAVHTAWVVQEYWHDGELPAWAVFTTLGILALALVGCKLIDRVHRR